MTRLHTRLLAVLAPVALLLPAAAHAEEVVVDDATGDARAVNLGAVLGELVGGVPPEGPYFLDAPAETSTDIVRTTIDHARKRLTLTMQLRDLVDTTGYSVDARIFTPDGRFDLTVGTYGGRTSAELYPARGPVMVFNSDDPGTIGPEPRPCRTVRARFDLAADTLTASVPTACLGAPRWVQVAAGAGRDQVTPQPDGSVNLAGYADDAFRSGLSMTSRGRSPKVRRG